MNTSQPTPPPDKPQGAEPELSFRNPTPEDMERTAKQITGFVADRDRSMLVRHLQQKLNAANEALEKAKAELAAYAETHRDVAHYNQELRAVIEQSGKREAALREALKRIEKWSGEFPETNRFWDEEKTRPMTYSAAFGSNGERDYMRDIARSALSQQAPTNSTTGSTPQG